jgi:hypothetical protein
MKPCNMSFHWVVHIFAGIVMAMLIICNFKGCNGWCVSEGKERLAKHIDGLSEEAVEVLSMCAVVLKRYPNVKRGESLRLSVPPESSAMHERQRQRESYWIITRVPGELDGQQARELRDGISAHDELCIIEGDAGFALMTAGAKSAIINQLQPHLQDTE